MGADATSHIDSSTGSGQTYDYRVRAGNAGGASPYSNVVMVTTPSIIVLTGVGTKVKGSHLVELSWHGAQSDQVEIHRNGAYYLTVWNLGTFADATGEKGKGSYEYRICEASAQDRCAKSIRIDY